MAGNDKLSIIAGELAQTGDYIPAVADDGSDEWTVCSAAYDDAVAETLEAHSFNFATNVETLVRQNDSPDDEYDDAYARPNQCLHVIWVRANDQTIDYKIINNQICLSARGATITCKFIYDPGVANWPALFAKIIKDYVRAAIYAGLHEDPQLALAWEGKAEKALAEARSRVDQESPKRAIFNSRAIMTRRVRRPWVRTPQGWSGTDAPS